MLGPIVIWDMYTISVLLGLALGSLTMLLAVVVRHAVFLRAVGAVQAAVGTRSPNRNGDHPGLSALASDDRLAASGTVCIKPGT